MNNKMNLNKVNGVVKDMEKLLGQYNRMKKRAIPKNRDDFDSSDWDQLSSNKEELRNYVKNILPNKNLTAEEIAKVSKIIKEKADDSAQNNMFKVLKYRKYRNLFNRKESRTYQTLLKNLDKAYKKTKENEIDDKVEKTPKVSLDNPDNQDKAMGQDNNQQMPIGRIIIIRVDDPDNVTKERFEAGAAKAGIEKNDWQPNDAIWLVKTSGTDGQFKAKLVEYDPENPEELRVISNIQDPQNESDFEKESGKSSNSTNSKKVNQKKILYRLDAYARLSDYDPKSAIITSENSARKDFFVDTVIHRKNLIQQTTPKQQKFSSSATKLTVDQHTNAEITPQEPPKSQQEIDMDTIPEEMMVKEQTDVDNYLKPPFKKDINDLKNEMMRKINDRVEKNNQVIKALEKEEKDKLSRALNIFKAFDDIEKETDPDMRTGRLLSLQDFISKQDPNNFKKSSKLFEKDLAENLGNYAAQIITAHNKREAAVKNANDVLKQSDGNDNVLDKTITLHHEAIHNIKVEDDEDVDKLFPDDDENEFDEENPLQNADDPVLKALHIQQENFKFTKDILKELSDLNHPTKKISNAEKIERLAAAQQKMAKADYPNYTIKNDGTYIDQVKHLARHAMEKLNQTKQILANTYKRPITPDNTDNQILEIAQVFKELIQDREDELVIGNTPKGVMNQSQLDHHEPINPATMFSHPKKDDIDDRQLKQNDALKNEDDDHEVNKFGSNSN